MHRGGCGYKAGLYILEDRPEDGIHLPEDQLGVFYLVPVGIFALTSIYCAAGIISEIVTMGKGEE